MKKQETVFIFILLLFLAIISAKVRYKNTQNYKFRKLTIDEEDFNLFGFLGKITSSKNNLKAFEQPNEEKSETKKVHKVLKDYCIKPRGTNAYDQDCHKFVDCWDSAVVLKTCNPSSLVYDAISGQCRWSWEPGMKEKCKKDISRNGNTNKIPLQSYCRTSRGKNVFEPDCHKFVDCWDTSAELLSCYPPNFVFNPSSGKCVGYWDIEMEQRCKSNQAYKAVKNEVMQKTNFDLLECKDFSHLGYVCVPDWKCMGGKFYSGAKRQPQQGPAFRDPVKNSSSIFQPWLKTCPIHSETCCRDSEFQPIKIEQKDAKSSSELCPSEFTGLRPVPYDCTKFANCWKGTPVIQSCGPGTHFNAVNSVCDWPSKANCKPQALVGPTIIYASREHTNISDSNEQIGSIHLTHRSSKAMVNLVYSSPPSGQMIRLRGGNSPFSGYLEMYRGYQWGFVCDSSSWTLEEANLVCKQLGFGRGVRSTTQGLIFGPIDEERKMTERVECLGHESRLEKCQIRYKNRAEQCNSQTSIVAITCVHDTYAFCKDNEVPWRKSCYSVHFDRSSFSEAAEACKSQEKRLVEINDQDENDLLSELLLHSHSSPGILAQAWTGARATRTARKSTTLWHASSQSRLSFHNWWPGWNGERKMGSMSLAGDMGVSLKRKYEFSSQPGPTKFERLIDYYFWTLEDLDTRLPFICERPQNEIGCIVGNGESYRGHANRGESGVQCEPWDSPYLTIVLDREKIGKLGNLTGNNFCRNPDGDVAPWCMVANGEFDYCDLPKCDEMHASSGGESDVVLKSLKCAADEYQCKTDPSECILSAYVCDGQRDCSNGADETSCDDVAGLSAYVKWAKRRLDVPYLERWLQTTPKACALHCSKARSFECRSFNYHAAKRLCVLNEANIGLTGMLGEDAQWDYYEAAKTALTCEPALRCKSGKCLDASQVCDGKLDCGDLRDRTDEKDCPVQANVTVRLVGGTSPNQGYVEVKAYDHPFGGVCDDGFGLEEAHVVCRMAGYRLGAREALIGSYLGHGEGDILLDDLHCKGGESSILECTFGPWTKHDCRPSEWAGVICIIEEEICENEQQHWRCESGECISLEFVCNDAADCADGSDEEPLLCESPVEIRLADGNNATTGRVELKYKGTWGTVCDDNFGEEEGQVVCRMLGFDASTPVIHAEAAFSPGSGPIWIHSIVCGGHERSLRDCASEPWAPTFKCKHLEDVGIECIPNNKPVSGGASAKASHECGLAAVPNRPAVPVARIAGGLQAPPGTSPWAVSIRLQGSAKSFHWCGGVLLSEFHVLTVAHCMEDYPKDVYRIRIGDWDMQVADIQEQTLEVEAVHFHEQYNVGVYLNNDIAMLKVKGRVLFGDRVSPACLPYANVAYGEHLNCSVTGWGSLGPREPGYTRYLQSAAIPYLDTGLCMAPHIYGPKKLSAGMFCAGYLEGGVDTCQGDSGGGLMCDIRGRQAVFGLTSWGYGCGRPNRPGVYTKVADYLDWINEKMAI